MLHAGLDLSRRKVDVCLISGDEVIDEWASPPAIQPFAPAGAPFRLAA